MISNEPYLPYNRPMLTKSLMADLTEEQIAMQSKEWYEEQNIHLILGKEVTGLDTEQKRGPAGGRYEAGLYKTDLRPWFRVLYTADSRP